jgi:small subunit ribosomal protein S1
LDEYLAEHKPGDVVSGRLIEITGYTARVELGEGIETTCQISEETKNPAESKADSTKEQPGKADLSSLSSMLQARWKGGATAATQPEPIRPGQVRNFRITKLDPSGKRIDVKLA